MYFHRLPGPCERALNLRMWAVRATAKMCGLLLAGCLLGLSGSLSFGCNGPISDFPSMAEPPGGFPGASADAGTAPIDAASDSGQDGEVGEDCTPADGSLTDAGDAQAEGGPGSISQPLVPPIDRPLPLPDGGFQDAGPGDAGSDAATGDAEADAALPTCSP
jgi:hypothetical protein